MKRILLALSMLALFLPAAPSAHAHTDVSIDFFYNNLGNDGSWTEIGDYGYGWQPSVAASNRNWRPYSDGYWAYTDVGWTWVSYEDFGWATYHYGRWTRLRDRGWFWIPGTEWGPAWVSWRTGGDYVGWAALPPRGGGREVVYEGRPVNGQVDLDYDIGPASYNFIDVRYIGEPLLRERIFEPGQNYGYVNRTVNVTNISYNNAVVYNYGPDYNTLSAYSTRPIQRLSIQRDTSADFAVAAQSGAFAKVQGDKLIVAGPQTLQRPTTLIAPKTVKEKIAQPNFERGWSGSDEKTIAQLKQKIKTEDAKKVPPPDIAPKSTTAAASTAATPLAGTSPAAAPSPAPPTTSATVTPATAATPAPPAQPQNGKGKNKRGQNAAPVASPTGAPATSDSAGQATAASPAPPAQPQNGKGKNKRGQNAAPVATPAGAPGTSDSAGQATAASPAAPAQPNGKGKNKRGQNATPVASPPAGAVESQGDSAAPAPVTATPKQAGAPEGNGKGKGKDKRVEKAPTVADPSAPPTDSAAAGPADQKPAKNKGKRGETAPAAAGPDVSSAPAQDDVAPVKPEGNKRNGRNDRAIAPPTAPAAAAAPEAAPAEPRGNKRNRDRGDGVAPAPGGAPAAETRRGPDAAPRLQQAAPDGAPAPQGGNARPGKGDKHKKGEPEAPPPSPTPQ